MQVLRHLGLAARFVSGYLIQLKPDVKSLDGPSGTDVDFTDLHAWTEVYLPGAGWIGLDPTSGLMAGEGHIPLAATPDPQGAAPVTGEVDECEVTFGHEMSVRRIYESPRVTKPYTDEQWRQIDALGRFIDTELRAHDVRLTMGGEPTFVSIDDMDGAEWNFTALGDAKRHLAGRARPAPEEALRAGRAAALRAGQVVSGRVAAALGARLLVAARRRAALARRQRSSPTRPMDYGHGDAEASRFIHALADALAVDGDHVIPAYEDVWHYLMAERRLPVNVDPLKSELKNEEERARLARVFEQGLDTHRRLRAAGAAPERVGRQRLDERTAGSSDRSICSSSRVIRRSATGCRSIRCRGRRRTTPTRSSRPIPSRAATRCRGASSPSAPMLVRARHRRRRAPAAPVAMQPPPRGKSAAGVIRTALCVEPRHGRVHVFMPPVRIDRGLPRSDCRPSNGRRPGSRCRSSSKARRPSTTRGSTTSR